jgi:hypothetical protein
MLWGDFKYGLIIKFIGGLLGIPFAIKLKLWDVLFLNDLKLILVESNMTLFEFTASLK